VFEKKADPDRVQDVGIRKHWWDERDGKQTGM
jgi:hypothetical protein